MAQSILVPLDGSGFGEHALPLAMTLARRSGAELRLALVHEPVLLVEPAGGAILSAHAETAAHACEQEYLRKTAKRMQDSLGRPVKGEMMTGAVVESLLEYIHRELPQWVVMSTHGRGPLSRFWLGSVADGLVRSSPVPVLLTRPASEEPGFTKDVKIDHVVICLDGSPLGEKVIEPATTLAQTFGAEVHLLRVVQPPMFNAIDPTKANPDAFGQPETAKKQQEAKNYLEQVATRIRTAAAKVGYDVLTDRHPAAAILSYVGQRPNALAALSTHGRSGLGRALIGSVADKVVRGSGGPVLVCRPSERGA